MLSPTVTYLGSAHPLCEASAPEVPPEREIAPALDRGAQVTRERGLRARLNLKLVVPLTTIAIFALPAADAFATGSWR